MINPLSLFVFEDLEQIVKEPEVPSKLSVKGKTSVRLLADTEKRMAKRLAVPKLY